MTTSPPTTGVSASTHATARQSRAVRWAVGVGAAIMSAIGLVLLFLLTLATNNRVLYERNYAWLFGVNVFVALLLLLVLGWVAVRLGLRLRKGRFGSRLLVKLAAIFALVGLMPGLLIYVVSYQFVTRSIESWFDVKVEGALSAGAGLLAGALGALVYALHCPEMATPFLAVWYVVGMAIPTVLGAILGPRLLRW